jgi:hypothetical protein
LYNEGLLALLDQCRLGRPGRPIVIRDATGSSVMQMHGSELVQLAALRRVTKPGHVSSFGVDPSMSISFPAALQCWRCLYCQDNVGEQKRGGKREKMVGPTDRCSLRG